MHRRDPLDPINTGSATEKEPISRNIDTELVKMALGNAIARCGGLKGAVFHSDRGSPFDNACTESFFAMAKKSAFT